ncbi:MAG: UPF0182 family protein [Acidaminobacteraceae bacterium]
MLESKKLSKFMMFLALIVLVILVFARPLVNLATSYLWLKSISFENVFNVSFKAQLMVGIPVIVFIFLVLYIYIRVLLKNYYKFMGAPEKSVVKKNKLVAAIYPFFFAVSYGSSFASTNWLRILTWLNKADFGYTDPIFMNDVSFYTFSYPLMNSVVEVFILLVFWLIVTTIGFYMLMFKTQPPEEGKIIYLSAAQSKKFELKNFFDKSVYAYLVKKVTILASIIFVLIGFTYILKGYELLVSPRGVAVGASYTDINITLLSYRILAILAFLSAITLYIGYTKKKLKLAVSAPVGFFAVAIVSVLVATFVQQIVVEPDEISKEMEYLDYNIKNTQRAFDLENVKSIDYNVDQNLTLESLEENDDVIRNIRINDSKPLKQTYNEIQGIRLYYQFNDVDLDRYIIDGEYRDVFISAREMNHEKLAEKAKTWINEHLVYTHGYGIVLSPVNVVTDDGQPDFMVKNIPPITNTDILITRPEIYFGEKMNDYIVVNTDEQEFDYPKDDAYQTTVYDGEEGVRLSFLNKILFSIKENSLKLILANKINDESKLIINRNIFDRVSEITPFLEIDNDPYIVIGDSGRFYWIIDAYTTSALHPYSQSFLLNDKEVNYARNSVKIVVDAYSGETSYYIFDDKDPILQTYINVYGDLFKAKSELPDGLIKHVKYPQEFLKLQAEVYKTYHITSPVVFYNGEDYWDIAQEKYMSEVQLVNPNYMSFQMPGSDGVEFLLTIPYTPREKANMTSLLIAQNDGENYGKLTLLEFPKDKTIQGPMMVESRIDQDSVISPQLTLWSQEGSNVLRGNLLVIPIDSSLLYVEPIYLEADNANNLPEMKMVILAYEDKVVMEETLQKAIAKIFGDKEVVDEKIDYSQGEIADFSGLIEKIEKAIDKSEEQLNFLNELLDELKIDIN